METRLVYSRSSFASEAERSEFGFEVSVKSIEVLVVGSWNEIVEEVSISRAGNMGPKVGGSGASIEDNDVLGVYVLFQPTRVDGGFQSPQTSYGLFRLENLHRAGGQLLELFSVTLRADNR